MNSLKPTEYKYGDYHPPTGRMVMGYYWRNNKWNLKLCKATNTFEMQIEEMFKGALQRARKNNLPFDIDTPYLKSIAKQTCPIFDIQLNWGMSPNGSVKSNSPSLDKVIPEWGYIKGNVAIISFIANKIKQDVTYNDLYKVADWLHDQEKETKKNVKPEQLASLPKVSNRKSKNNTEHGVVHGAGAWEDGNGADNHIGESERDNSHCGTEASSGVGMGSGVSKMGASEALQGGEGDGDTQAKADSIGKFIEHLHNQSREFGVAVGMWENVRLPNHRREQSVQGPVDETIQSTEETFKKLQEKVNPDWNSESTGTARFVVTGRYTGFRTEAGDKPNEV